MVRLLQILTLSCLLSFPLIGGDCEKILLGGNIPPEMTGTWELIEQSGALQDICLGETINFQSNGTAELTCPASNPVMRNYSVQSDVLSYTETSVSYDIQFSNKNNNLALYGRNISRNLLYQRIITSNSISDTINKNKLRNSSETGK